MFKLFILYKRTIIKLVSFFIKRTKNIENNKPIALNGNEKILIIKLDEIGDFILSLPLSRELKNNYPGLRIDLLSKRGVENIAELCPYFTNTFF